MESSFSYRKSTFQLPSFLRSPCKMAIASLENGLLRVVILLMALCSPLASASSHAPARAQPPPEPEPEQSTAPASEIRVQVSESSTFGPGDCVSLSRTKHGTCMLSTKCASQNISDTEFSFVCFNANTSLPHALHSFGRGGFEQEEQFDTGVRCQTCATVALAFETGGPLVQNALKSLPSDVLPDSSLPAKTVEPEAIESVSEPSSEPKNAARIPEKSSYETAPNGTQYRTMKPAEASYYGPESCVAAFRAPSGTCVIETRCEEEALANFNMGVTCVDKAGSSAKYLFGKGIFQPQEIFDTRLQCEACLGVGEDVNKDKLTGYMPKQLIEDVNSLKEQMKQLSEQLRALGGENATSDEESTAGKKEKEEGFDCEAGVDAWQEGWSDAKKEFCCKSVGTGCKLFNCSVAVDEWERGWSEMKKEFCCKDTGVGCKENTLKVEVEEAEKKEEAKGGKSASKKTTTPSESTPSPATEEEDLAPAPSLASAPATKTDASSSPEEASSEELAKAPSAPVPAPEVVPAEKKESLLASDATVMDQDTPVILHHRQQGQAMPALKDVLRVAAFRNQH